MGNMAAIIFGLLGFFMNTIIQETSVFVTVVSCIAVFLFSKDQHRSSATIQLYSLTFWHREAYYSFERWFFYLLRSEHYENRCNRTGGTDSQRMAT